MRSLVLLGITVTSMMIPSAKASICSNADSCLFTFDVHNNGPTTFGSGPYGTLSLTLNNVDHTILATIDLADGFGLINTGFPNGNGTTYAFGFNDNLGAADFNYGSYNPNTYGGGTTAAGAYQFDGFGDFDRAAAHTTLPNTGGANLVSFIITRTGGFNSVQNLVGANNNGLYFVADVFYNGTNTPGSCAADASCTGLIGVTGGGTATPEPISSALVGTGLISLFFIRRRAGKKA